jgi:hypothetical protein
LSHVGQGYRYCLAMNSLTSYPNKV